PNRGASADGTAMFGGDVKISLAGILEVAIPRVKIGFVGKHASAAVAEFTGINCIVVIVERQKAKSRAAIFKQTIAVENFSRCDLLLIADPNAVAGEVAEGFILVLHFGFKLLL